MLFKDERRRREGRCDIFVCIKREHTPPPRKEFVKQAIDKYYIPVLFNPVVKVFIFFFPKQNLIY